MRKIGLLLLVCLFLLLFVSAPVQAQCPPGQFVQDPVTGQLVFVPSFRSLPGGQPFFGGSPVTFGSAAFNLGLGVGPLGTGSFILNNGAGDIRINQNIGGFGGRRFRSRRGFVQVQF